MFVKLTDYKTQKPVLVNMDLVVRASEFSERQGKPDKHIGTRFDTVSTNSNVRDGSSAVFTVDIRETMAEVEHLLINVRTVKSVRLSGDM